MHNNEIFSHSFFFWKRKRRRTAMRGKIRRILAFCTENWPHLNICFMPFFPVEPITYLTGTSKHSYSIRIFPYITRLSHYYSNKLRLCSNWCDFTCLNARRQWVWGMRYESMCIVCIYGTKVPKMMYVYIHIILFIQKNDIRMALAHGRQYTQYSPIEYAFRIILLFYQFWFLIHTNIKDIISETFLIIYRYN